MKNALRFLLVAVGVCAAFACFLLAVAALATVGSYALAAEPRVTPAPRPSKDCGVDEDRDGFCVADKSRNDAAGKPGFLLGEKDCNDGDPAVNPGAAERLGNGIDDDCDGIVDYDVPQFAKNFCRVVTPRCVYDMEEEIKVCEAGACSVNKNTGAFKPSFGWHFVDEKCDGVRELMDQDAFDAFVTQKRADLRNPKWEPHPSGRCVATSKKPTCTGPDCPVRKPAAPKKPDPKVVELDGKVTGLTADVAAQGVQIVEIVGGLVDLNDQIGALGESLAAETLAREEADKAEAKAREDGDKWLADALDKNETTARGAQGLAVRAFEYGVETRKMGVLVALSLEAFYKEQQGLILSGGETLRGFHAPGVRSRFFVGTEFFQGVLGGAILAEEGPKGTELALLLEFGVQVLWKLENPENAIGVGVHVHNQTSGGSVLSSHAVSRGVGVEFVLELDLLLFGVRLGVDQLGTAGTRGEDEDAAEFSEEGFAPFITLFGGGKVLRSGVVRH